MSRDLIDRTQGKWRSILLALGIADTLLTGRHTPCPMCGGKDRFRFDNKSGSGSWICSQCGSGYGIHLVQHALGLTQFQAMSEIEKVIGKLPAEGPTPVTKMPAAVSDLTKVAALWQGAISITPNSPASAYLRSRGLGDGHGLRGLRFVQHLLYLDENGDFAGRLPAMVALIQDSNDKPVGIHRTYLASGGNGQAKVPYPKKVLGSIPDGAAVRLFKREKHLGIAEGIETALSVHSLFGVPTWAAINAGGLEKWWPPQDVTTVTVFGDNDKKFRGQFAAYALANRLAVRGYTVDVKIPGSIGQDWNDILQSPTEPAKSGLQYLDTTGERGGA